jgi:hypothetical protein
VAAAKAHRSRATRLDVSAHELTVGDGELLRDDKLLLSTGSSPRPLPVPGADLDGVLYLRAVGDSDNRLDLDGYLYFLFHSTRGELLRRLDRDDEERAAYRRALELATSTPERRFLTRRLERL